MDKQKQIEEIAWIIQNDCNNRCNCNDCKFKDNNFKKIYDKHLECENISRAIRIYDTLIPEGSVVLSKEEYEKLKSLYDSQQGAYMTSSIGDLPLSVEGLRKAVDEISRLLIVQAELQELNSKYYNEAKDLRREVDRLKDQARKETASEIFETLIEVCKRGNVLHLDTLIANAKRFGVEV